MKNFYINPIDDKNSSIAFVNENTFNAISSNLYVQPITFDFITYNPDTENKNIGEGINNYWLYNYFHQLLIKTK